MAHPTKVADLKDLSPGKSACVEFGGVKVRRFPNKSSARSRGV